MCLRDTAFICLIDGVYYSNIRNMYSEWMAKYYLLLNINRVIGLVLLIDNLSSTLSFGECLALQELSVFYENDSEVSECLILHVPISLVFSPFGSV